LCDGVEIKIVNANTRMVEIEWNEQKVMEGDPKVTRQKLMVRSWNPKKPQAGLGESSLVIQMHKIVIRMLKNCSTHTYQ
jgi:hypothetical protein